MRNKSFPDSRETFSVTEERIKQLLDEGLQKLRHFNLPLREPLDSLDDKSRRHTTQLKLPVLCEGDPLLLHSPSTYYQRPRTR
jgi:hypothetical protein